MTMTTTPTFPVREPQFGSWVRRNLVWVFVALALAVTIATVLAIAVTDDDAGTDLTPEVLTETDAGTGAETILDQSITARDHEAAERRPDSLLDASITARDHAAQKRP